MAVETEAEWAWDAAWPTSDSMRASASDGFQRLNGMMILRKSNGLCLCTVAAWRGADKRTGGVATVVPTEGNI
ncbi:hypothetical protein GCM10010532_036180 [Dactylosporangium siamense]|uniref:Uncharacterized protein n=1 Tax=Dactylosporangium siamense TaxID=685454 RepID=A0A919PJ13_9ACTN|nr:hypothetical protein Dsi01nite_028600 [Dactylosporangium siamense]